MAYRYGKRHQRVLFPQCVDDYIADDAPVRAYDAFVEVLELEQLGIQLEPHKAGCPQYDPKAMLKLLVYGYSYGVRSSRKLERECHYNLSFIWLMGDLKPDHKTIAEFRRKNKFALKNVMSQCAQMCIKLGLIDGNILFVDGTAMHGNASLANSWTRDKCSRALKKVDQAINLLLEECEHLDQQEQSCGSLVKMRAELTGQEKLKEKIQTIKQELDKTGEPSINTVDSDAVRQNGRQGCYAGYSMQAVADDKHGLLVNMDVVSANNDLGLLSDQVKQANEILSKEDKQCKTACSDAGYCRYEDLAKVENGGVRTVVPSAKQAKDKKPGDFDKEFFRYDQKKDVLCCPQGRLLPRVSKSSKYKRIVYRGNSQICQACEHFGTCTKSKQGRTVERYFDEGFRQKLARRYETAESQEVYKRRKEKVELVFGHIKSNIGIGGFLLRGLAGVRAEASLLGCVFNLRRVITLLGVPGLLGKLA